MNGFGWGSIGQIYPDLGIGTIRPEKGGPEIIFTDHSVAQGGPDFRDLKPGQRVRYHLHPEEIAGRKFAVDVEPDPARG